MLPWTARTRRLIFVIVILVVLTFPLVSTLTTRARVERSGMDVTATVVETTRNGDAYLVAFRFPDDVDPDRRTYTAEVERTSYEAASESEEITVRVLEGRPEAHLVEGEIHSRAPYYFAAVADALVLLVGLWWVRVGRRRPTVRLRADGPLQPAAADEPPGLDRSAGADDYEAVGTLLSTDDAEAVLDVGDRQVVVVLDGHPNPVDVGSPARVRGAVIG
jgi:hypothetical protein